MKTSSAGVALIKKFEGFSPVPYTCPAGKVTIGYGHVIKPGETFTTLAEEEATQLLMRDLVNREQAVMLLVKVPLTQGQFDALVSFVFNLGVGALKSSTLLKRLNAGEYERAADNFQRWVFVGHTKLKGLETRRAAEWAMFTSKGRA